MTESRIGPARPAVAAAFFVSLIAAPAHAASQCLVTYEDYEANVPHVDLAECPADEISAEQGFCRLQLDGDTAVVHVFEFRDDRACLVDANVHPVDTLFD